MKLENTNFELTDIEPGFSLHMWDGKSWIPLTVLFVFKYSNILDSALRACNIYGELIDIEFVDIVTNQEKYTTIKS